MMIDAPSWAVCNVCGASQSMVPGVSPNGTVTLAVPLNWTESRTDWVRDFVCGAQDAAHLAARAPSSTTGVV